MSNNEIMTELYKAIANIQKAIKAINEIREDINISNETKETKREVRI